ncbi:MAG: site-2 protease family protein [Bythopirellula sp.]
MISHSADNWSVFAGRPGGVEVRIHILWPLTALAILWAVMSTWFAATLAIWGLLVFFVSVTLHELARAITASRVGGHPSALVLGPIGGLTKLHLPIDPPAHLVTALAGPMTYLVLLVVAGCGLAMTDSPDVLKLLLNPCAPGIEAPRLNSPMTHTLFMIAQLTVWINWCLLLVSILPVDPCDGAELLRGMLWPMVGRSTATSATSRIAVGGALFMALMAVLIGDKYSPGNVPTWLPLSVISVFLFYGGRRLINTRYYDVGLAIDEFDSDDEDREAVLVEHLQDKQQEALDRKRREREASEDARVDAILMRLRNISFDQLSEEDRATLKRASRRYRERREEQGPEE